MICDDCKKEAPTYEIADMQLCAGCIEPPEGEESVGVLLIGTRAFVVGGEKAYEILENIVESLETKEGFHDLH